MAQVTLYYEAGMIAHLNVNWLAPVKVRQVLLGGSKKMIVYDDLQPSDKLKIYDRGLNAGRRAGRAAPTPGELSHGRHVVAATLHDRAAAGRG